MRLILRLVGGPTMSEFASHLLELKRHESSRIGCRDSKKSYILDI